MGRGETGGQPVWGRCQVLRGPGQAPLWTRSRRLAAAVRSPGKFAKGIADAPRHIGGRAFLLRRGCHLAGRECPHTGSGDPAAAASIIPLLIGGARQAGGAIHSLNGWTPCSPQPRNMTALPKPREIGRAACKERV